MIAAWVGFVKHLGTCQTQSAAMKLVKAAPQQSLETLALDAGSLAACAMRLQGGENIKCGIVAS